MATQGDSALFFTAKDDPRDGCMIVGHTSNTGQDVRYDKHILYDFRTNGRRTTVYRNTTEVVAYLDWGERDTLGMLTMGTRQEPMSNFLLPIATTPNVRVFISAADRLYYEWHKVDHGGYDFYPASIRGQRLATFRRDQNDTPVGLTHATMKYNFDHDHLLLESLVALCLNRWVDRPAT
ncbi:hypothetical protein BKA93DRAFT_726660 [Sparassis latifolia]